MPEHLFLVAGWEHALLPAEPDVRCAQLWQRHPPQVLEERLLSGRQVAPPSGRHFLHEGLGLPPIVHR